MPIIAVAAAAASFTTGMAIAGAVGASMAATVVGGAMMVGGALTAIGTVTGNQKLAKIGGVLSLAGGIGALATSAANAAGSVAGEVAADAAGVTVSEGGAAINEAAHFSDAAFEAGAQNAASAPTTSLDVGVSNAANASAPATGQQGLLNTELTSQAPVQPTTAANQMPVDAGANSTFQTNAADTMTAQNSAGNTFDPEMQKLVRQNNSPTGLLNTNLPTFNTNAPVGGDSMWTKFQAWTKENPDLAKMTFEGVKGVAGNLVTSPKDQAMIDYYNQNAEAIKRKGLWATGRIA